MKKKIRLFTLTALLVGLSVPTAALQTKKIARIGVLCPGLSPGAPYPELQGLRQGLRDLGYVEEKNITIEYRFAEGKLARLPELATELVRLNVNVIAVMGGSPAIVAAKSATSTIPIVFPTVGDPVGLGFVESLAHPGGNMTGLTIRTPEFSGKRLELLKEVVPSARRVAVLGQEANAGNALDFKQMEIPASALGLQLHQIKVRGPNDFEAAFSEITRTVHATALFLQANNLFVDNRGRIAALATKQRLPAIHDRTELAEAGILLSYGAERFGLGQRAAYYVDRILKGAQPADLPVEQPTKFELVINLKTAKQIGLAIPPNVLARADKVIK